MNKRTAKMLKEYARMIDKDEKSLKKWWKKLSWMERTRKRQEIEDELYGDEDEVVEEAVVEEVAE